VHLNTARFVDMTVIALSLAMLFVAMIMAPRFLLGHTAAAEGDITLDA